MGFESDNPFQEAIDFLRSKELMPTHLSSAELSLLDREVRRKSLFSARNTSAASLSKIAGTLDKMATGQVEMATAKAAIQDSFDELGYTPELGFEPGRVPPAERGSLRDLSSDARVKLVLETNFRQAANYGLLVQGNDDASLWQYPAWELVRVYTRIEERPNWPERFVRAGGRLWDGRMIALKGDPVWSNLGNSGMFSDGIDADFPPYAFNSGMGWVEVHRDECEKLGLISGSQSPRASVRPAFDAGMDDNLGIFTNDFLTQVIGS